MIGPYLTQCGGADAVQPYKLIAPLIAKYAALGNVIYEGALVSSCWGAVGKLLERFGRDATVAFLDTPVDECVSRVKARRAEKARRAGRDDDRVFNPANLIQKHTTIAKLKVKLDAAGIVRTVTISDAADLLSLLTEVS